MEAKQNLGFSQDDFLVCSFGFIVPTKKIDSVVKNLKKFLKDNPRAKYIVVGELDKHYGEQIKKIVEDLNLTSQIIFTDFIDEKQYKQYLHAQRRRAHAGN